MWLDEFVGVARPRRSPYPVPPKSYGSTDYGFAAVDPAPTDPLKIDVLQQKYSRRYVRLLQLLHAVQLANGPTLVPTLALNVFGPEDYYPEEQLCWGTVSQAQTAGQRSQLQLFNSTGQLLVIERVLAARLQTAGEIEIRLAAGAQGTPNNPSTRDFRFAKFTGFPAGVRCDASAVAASANQLLARIWSGAAQNPGDIGAIIIPPFSMIQTPGILLQPTIDNEGLSATFLFRQITLTNPGIN